MQAIGIPSTNFQKNNALHQVWHEVCRQPVLNEQLYLKNISRCMCTFIHFVTSLLFNIFGNPVLSRKSRHDLNPYDCRKKYSPLRKKERTSTKGMASNRKTVNARVLNVDKHVEEFFLSHHGDNQQDSPITFPFLH